MQKWCVSILFLLECAAVFLLMFFEQPDFLSFLALHALISCGFAYLCTGVAVSNSHSSQLEKYVYLILIIGFIPVFGMLIALFFGFPRYFLQEKPGQSKHSLAVCEIEEPGDSLINFTEADSVQLLHALHEDTYLDLLLSARSLPKGCSLNLWKEAMSSNDENARLVGYCFSSEFEDSFQQHLNSLLNELDKAEHKNDSSKHLLVADLYWQHIREGVQQQNHAPVLKKIVSHAMRSIRLDSTNSYSYLLLGELMSYQKRDDEASYFFKKALALGQR